MDDKEKLSEGEKIYNLTQTDDWQIVKGRFDKVIGELADIREIPSQFEDGSFVPAEQRTYEMQVRERTVLLLEKIINSISGDADEYQEMIKDIQKPSTDFMIRFDK